MITRILITIGFAAASLLLADGAEPQQKVQVSKTERFDFPSGGTLRLANSTGVLTVEGWDRPDVEITTIRTSRAAYESRDREHALQGLKKVRVVSTRNGDELVVDTDSPKHADCDLEYRIKAPVAARLIAHHRAGEVSVDGLTGDIDVTLGRGEIFLHLPEDGRYNISAKCDLGNVYSDYPGQEKRAPWLLGHRIENGDSAAPHKLNLKVGLGYGDIVIMKAQSPKSPGSTTVAPKSNGL